MKNWLLICTFLLFLFAFSNNYQDGKQETLIHSFVKSQDSIYIKEHTPDLKVLNEGWEINGKKNSWWTSYYLSGKTSKKGAYYNDLKDGLWTCYYENGNIECLGNYLENKMVGYWKFYNKNGQLIKSGHYDNNLKTGFWKFFENNKVIKEGWYHDNHQVSYWNIYDEYGNFSHAINYSED